MKNKKMRDQITKQTRADPELIELIINLLVVYNTVDFAIDLRKNGALLHWMESTAK